MPIGIFDPEQRALEKDAARRAVDADIESGRVSHADMQARNSIFANVDFSRARIVVSEIGQIL